MVVHYLSLIPLFCRGRVLSVFSYAVLRVICSFAIIREPVVPFNCLPGSLCM